MPMGSQEPIRQREGAWCNAVVADSSIVEDGIANDRADITDDDLDYIKIIIFDASSPGNSFIMNVLLHSIVRAITQHIIEERSFPLDTDHVSRFS